METVVIKIVGDDELTVAIFGFRSSENCVETKADLLIDPLEEVLLGRLGNQSEDISKGILFRADAVVWWDDDVCVNVGLLDLGGSLPAFLLPSGAKMMLNLVR